MTAAIVASPQIVSMRNSADPKARTASRSTGISRISTITPKVDPIADEAAEQPIAVLAWPFRAIGCPSIMVAALGAVPGMLKRIAVTEPMKVAPPTKAPNSKTVGNGSQLRVKEIASAIRVTPLSPGRKANTMASSVPTTGYRKLGQDETNNRPCQAAWKTDSIIVVVSG